ncbi:MAG: PA2779 family protein [Elusimicrobia bacterium]|nr:PA2779 family protein [Elusimicrobiota bacterium]
MKSGARALIYSLIASTTMLCTVSGNGWAMLAPAQGAATMGEAYGRAADMKTVQTALESKVVRERLKALGLTDKEIESRLTRLSDQQVHQLAKDVNTLSSGGFVEELLVIVILVLVIVFLVHHLR